MYKVRNQKDKNEEKTIALLRNMPETYIKRSIFFSIVLLQQKTKTMQ